MQNNEFSSRGRALVRILVALAALLLAWLTDPTDLEPQPAATETRNGVQPAGEG